MTTTQDTKTAADLKVGEEIFSARRGWRTVTHVRHEGTDVHTLRLSEAVVTR